MMNIAQQTREVTGQYTNLDGERYYQIANSHLMPDFMMSLVGASDHWMFVSSNGALTAGRQNANNALFPYAPDDQISTARSETGSTTLIRVDGESGPEIWEPFAAHSAATHRFRRNLYKTPLGDKLVFEEINETLGLAFRYRWTFSERFGFIRSCRLQNLNDTAFSVQLLDGLRNLLPFGVANDFTLRFSNLSNAYKKCELVEGSDLALFLLSSIPTDRAEPSEGLRATTVWQTGLNPDAILLSSKQVPAYRNGESLHTETDVRGRAGAFLLKESLDLDGGQSRDWHVVSELAQDHVDVVGLREWLKTTSDPSDALAAEIEASERNFLRIVSTSDGVQCTANLRRTSRHQSNTVFNVMRGGIPLENYVVHSSDFTQHVLNFNRPLHNRFQAVLEGLPDTLSAAELCSEMADTKDPDLQRLATEYLPLAFSRRHGDPTRPWNWFSIDLRSETGETSLHYQGNWRDLFQNWEALALSFPQFTTAMICRFANATTADGYNPYRVTKNGFDWEEPTPDDPWANIGYWGDHQIIYLLKLLEWNRRVDPSGLDELLTSANFVHANIPYRIRPFADIKRDPCSTIDFDADLAGVIATRVDEIGADGKLLRNSKDQIHRVTLFEKLLTLSLAKLSNFVPDGGIWMNTQRPEWNDANNALVGNGLSMVTACYLHRWFHFLRDWLNEDEIQSFTVSNEVAVFLRRISAVLSEHAASTGDLSDQGRAQIVEQLSEAGSDYRAGLYREGVSGKTTSLSRAECLGLFENARLHLDSTIRRNRRPDGLFHSYNLLNWQGDRLAVDNLYEMLEGQVAVLSSGLLSPEEVAALLDALRASSLYRENQNSYMLYPDRQLPRFLDRNLIRSEQIAASPLLQQLIESGNEQIVRRDVNGEVHFNGSFRNAADLQSALKRLPENLSEAAAHEGPALAQLFEETFDHRQFTGRSGTFFGYEGLGSIYWHMVSKLNLAVCENLFLAIESGANETTLTSLKDHYHAIGAGIGAEKSPLEYGAFASDPYSHTPENAGAKQPGMTGQVKEDVLSRFAELGAHVDNGCLNLRFDLFDRSELLPEAQSFTFFDLAGEFQTMTVPENAFAFTLCQVPILCQSGVDDSILITFANGEQQRVAGKSLDRETTRTLFSRTGDITKIECRFKSL